MLALLDKTTYLYIILKQQRQTPLKMATQATTIATEILNQLGGNKFLAMTGSKNLVATGNGLRMNLTKNKVGAKWLKISLGSMDTYQMEFIKEKKTLNKEMAALGLKMYDSEIVTVKEFEGVYCDQLQSIFTDTTGLYTKL